MSTSPLVTIAISTKDQFAAFVRALESARAQTYETLEILVLDHASTDNTKHYLKHIAKQDPRIRVVRHAVSTYGVASFHETLQEFRGDYLTLLSPYDRLAPSFVENAMADFSECPQAGLWYSHSKLLNSPTGQGQLPHRGPKQETGPSFLYHRLVTHKRGAFLSACVFKREIIKPIAPNLETTNLFELSLLISSCYHHLVIYQPKPLHLHFYSATETGDGYTGRQYPLACQHLLKIIHKIVPLNPHEQRWLKKCLSYHALHQIVLLASRNDYDFLERGRILKLYARVFFPYCVTNFFTFSLNQAGEYSKHLLQLMELWKQPKVLREFMTFENNQRPDEKPEDYHRRLVEEMMSSVLKAMTNEVDIHLWGEVHVLYAGQYFAKKLNEQFKESGLTTGKVEVENEPVLSKEEIEYTVEIVDQILKAQWLRKNPQRNLVNTASKLRRVKE